ncbi:Uncharacterised protein [Chlamydia trachomatis]|nr:Uncharacterised protein [Chlamydia trachomatis]
MRCIALSAVNVVEQRVIEQFGVLKHERNFANERLLRVGGKWFSANQHRARIKRVVRANKLRNGRLARARLTHQRIYLVFFKRERQILKNVFVAVGK